MASLNIINGKEIASEIEEVIKRKVFEIKSEKNIVPGLAVILVGEDPASTVYVRNKGKRCRESGMNSWEYKFPADVPENVILDKINSLNNDDSVDGILVQLPFPQSSELSERKIINHIDPNKDVDGLHISNFGKLVAGDNGLFPATPTGCLILLKKYIKNLEGLKALVVGRSNLVGKPIAHMLLKENCTVSIAHSKTTNIAEECINSDIIIAAVGIPKFIRGSWLKSESVVIDVGINRIQEDTSSKPILVGDVNFEEAIKHVRAITPVPGGVGPMTIACLLLNTLKAAKIRRGIFESSIESF
tara:strand:- start:342 stop:1247 length:906 start_codon:yes stop_codon:yes gene_type:complete